MENLATKHRIQDCQIQSLAEDIISLIFEQRRLLPIEDNAPFTEQIAGHVERVEQFIANNEPINMVLPAFPAKSPNRTKTLGFLPDKGEFYAFERLVNLCKQIESIYEPGAKVTICSDGRVFADIIHVTDSHVSQYVNTLRQYAARHYPNYFEFFNLEDVFDKVDDFTVLREELMIRYGESLSDLRQRVKNEKEASTMYKGITRFMLEDFSGIDKFSDYSRTALQKVAKTAAYRVIQRSNAWSRLLKDHLPEALRLSIHPQYLVSEKIGISLVSQTDVWTTPWHSVLVKDNTSYQLMPREQAEKLGCVLVFNEGRASHFERIHRGAE
ncbi:MULTISPECIES: L-tyrosine/L-tryptophan isonitrile synthase family protein [Pseudoalteromonas]|uniref:Pyoverdine biosynthesis protein n=1 Tax=Pseudoalteromonas piscicida TaxID=43662 RepID=A0AAD0W322_PSEO7|nr:MULTISPECIES: isocyanide synthase family protein [Pseudoalteromonas]ASD68220.1 pyoverdine biosynthesis protein [Pseudoalteromonas piscicida]AXR01071.1 pyoverdine biosynthesis protein [Pseudoalteromonas piscicida]RZG03241.1 pyoverdine biosynthesis protein [Pseudoalteromonas sp. CO348]